MSLLCRMFGHARVKDIDPHVVQENGLWVFPCPRCQTLYRPAFHLLPRR